MVLQAIYFVEGIEVIRHTFLDRGAVDRRQSPCSDVVRKGGLVGEEQFFVVVVTEGSDDESHAVAG